MKTPFSKHRLYGELKRLARENNGKPLSVMDDVVFKAMLTSDTEDSREALRSLLSACTGREVSVVQVINNDLIPPYLAAKSPRLDVHVTFNDGEAADLEMQLSNTSDDIKARAEYYAAMLLAGQSRKGKQYKEIKRVYQIFFLNFTLFPESSKIPRRYYYKEDTENDRLSDVTEIIFYEMPKLEKQVVDYLAGTGDLQSLSGDEKWCIYFKYRQEKWAEPLIDELCRKEDGIMRAEKTVTKVSRDYRKYAQYMAMMKNSMDRASDIDYARREGIAEGENRGRSEGIAEGETRGRSEEKLEIARKMKEMGISIEKIQTVTGLTAETIKSL
jgi:predicted transposase/invertase (TIGR01784 family)